MIRLKIKKEDLEVAKLSLREVNESFYPELTGAFQYNNPIASALRGLGYGNCLVGLSSVVLGNGDRYAIKDEAEKDGEEGPVSRALKNWIKTGTWNLNKDIEVLPRWIIKKI